jgi:hypothetical protein
MSQFLEFHVPKLPHQYYQNHAQNLKSFHLFLKLCQPQQVSNLSSQFNQASSCLSQLH